MYFHGNQVSDYHENETTTKIIDQLFIIAKEFHVEPGQVALAWVLSKGGFPIVGARTIDHINAGLQAASIQLDQLSIVTLGYPHDLLATVQS